MSNKRQAIIKNSTVGLMSQVVIMIFTFVTRSVFIKYIGIELSGLNSTFASILTALSLMELGFQSAIVFNLYKPLHENKIEEINSIMNILKLIYRCIGIFFIFSVLLLTPFLKFILSKINITSTIYVYFWLQSLASVCTYFLAYKRALLYADQKEYISKLIDLFFSVIFNSIQCLVLIIFRSYIAFLALKIIQIYISNLVIHLYCSKKYSFLYKDKLDKSKLKKILYDVRDIFASRIASFIYNSTDNLIISAFVSTISVGFFVNYTIITTSLKTITSSALSPLIPILGNHLIDENKKDEREKVFLLDTFIRYLMASVIIIPTGVLINDFIIWWIGKNMLLNNAVVILLCCDFYIHLVHGASMDFINSAGLFNTDKYVEFLGAATNIIISLVFVHQFGISGVLLGTAISQIVFWIGRSAIVYRECLNLGIRSYVKYWIINAIYLTIFIILSIIVNYIYNQINIESIFVRFFIGGIISEIIIVLTLGLVFWNSNEMKGLKQVFLGNDSAQ